jgi:hypothetical protein
LLLFKGSHRIPHMELEIQVLSWNRYKNVLELNNFFSSPCQRQCELLPSLGVCRLLTFHILIGKPQSLNLHKYQWNCTTEIHICAINIWGMQSNIFQFQSHMLTYIMTQCISLYKKWYSEKIMINKYSGVCDYFISGFALMFYFHP